MSAYSVARDEFDMLNRAVLRAGLSCMKVGWLMGAVTLCVQLAFGLVGGKTKQYSGNTPRGSPKEAYVRGSGASK